MRLAPLVPTAHPCTQARDLDATARCMHGLACIWPITSTSTSTRRTPSRVREEHSCFCFCFCFGWCRLGGSGPGSRGEGGLRTRGPGRAAMEAKAVGPDALFRKFTACPADPRVLLLDVRPAKDFRKHHVAEAYNIRLAANGKALLVRPPRCRLAVRADVPTPQASP